MRLKDGFFARKEAYGSPLSLRRAFPVRGGGAVHDAPSPLAGEGRGEGEIEGAFARTNAPETPALNRN